MDDQRKTKAQLIEELAEMRQMVDESTAFRQAEQALREHEAQLTQQVRHQEALLRITQTVQEMTAPEDLQRVTHVFFEELHALNPNVRVLTTHRLIDANAQIFESYRFQAPKMLDRVVSQNATLYRIWRNGQTVYRPDLDEDPEGRGNREKLDQHYGFRVQSTLGVTFSNGTLGILSPIRHAFSDAEVRFVERVAGVLSVGVERVSDLENLRSRTQALQESEERYRRLFETMEQGVVYQNAAGEITAANPAAERVLGLTLDQMQGRTSVDPRWKSIHPDGSDFPGETHASMVALRTGKPVHDVVMGVFNPDRDAYRWILINAVPEFRPGETEPYQVYTTFSDITALRQAEINLQESESRYRQLLEIAPVGIAVHTDGDLVFANPAGAKLLGAESPEDLLGRSVNTIVHPDMWDAARDRIQRMLAGEEGLYPLEDRYVRLDGTAIPVEVTAASLTYRGKPSVQVIVSDISRRKAAEQAQRESEERLRLALENIPDVIVIYDSDLRIQYINEATRRITGRPTTDFIGKREEEIWPPEVCQVYLPTLQEAFNTGAVRSLETQLLLPDTGVHHLRITCVPLLDEEGSVREVLGITHDLTEQKRTEQELVRLERLRALGELSAGVSHNLNNILTSVLGPAQLLLRTARDPDMRAEAERIVAAARRARDLVHHLHLSTRGVEGEEVEAVHVNGVIREAVETARPRWKDQPESRGIAVELATGLEDVPAVRATASRLHDIFINLILNAVDAMPEGGTITVRSRAAEGGVQVTFSDTGVGMDKETRRRVFEPFFTTKMDIGSGLGLSTAYNAATGWGGHIAVESAPGIGTTFTLWLPVWTEEAEAEGEPADVRGSRRGRLLVVEDDRGVSDFLCRLLGARHEVACVSDGREAMAGFSPGRYDAALIDIGIPGLPGDRVAREMREADPGLVTVLITGWELQEGDPRRRLFDFRLQKPFEDLDEVERVVARAVELHDERANME